MRRVRAKIPKAACKSAAHAYCSMRRKVVPLKGRVDILSGRWNSTEAFLQMPSAAESVPGLLRLRWRCAADLFLQRGRIPCGEACRPENCVDYPAVWDREASIRGTFGRAPMVCSSAPFRGWLGRTKKKHIIAAILWRRLRPAGYRWARLCQAEYSAIL